MSDMDTAPGSSLALLDRHTDSWVEVVADVARLAQTIGETDFIPKGLRGNPAAITAAILYGREVGLPPMQALRSVHMVDGRPAMAAEALRGLVLAQGHEMVYVAATGVRAAVRGRRRGQTQWHEVEWTIEMARAADLTGKTNWKRYPRAMLKARATSELCRDLFADVIGGFAAVEDMDALPTETIEPEAPSPSPTKTTVARARRPKALDVPPGPSSESAAPGGDGPLPAPTRDPGASNRVNSGMTEPPGDHDGWSDVPLPLGDDTPSDPDERASDAQGAKVLILLRGLGVFERDDRLEAACALVLRPVTTFTDLTRGEAHKMIEALQILNADEQGADKLAAMVRVWRESNPVAPHEDEPDYDPETGEVLP